ncbi:MULTISPECIES: ANTAR domain-containing protein [unclassified Streptomyces]|uniref:ANTAR domain-containing protein n=1 Tax=unclassified Streptomyces TaxID=2593676 RepID=UPI001F3EB198|nr:MULTISPECIES: ANTAR domain-containing protein [unclassified Streptomyces]WKX19507.1 ANTAR domain-containing protein [Streptomyces sp. HUAS CX7]
MTSSTRSGARPPAVPTTTDELVKELERVRAENRHLERALASHATVDRAIGVLTVLGRISPDDGFTVLREISQHTNIRLSAVAEHLLAHARGAELPDVLLGELHAALARHAGAAGGSARCGADAAAPAPHRCDAVSPCRADRSSARSPRSAS